jgi:AraC family transcriptional regulator
MAADGSNFAIIIDRHCAPARNPSPPPSAVTTAPPAERSHAAGLRPEALRLVLEHIDANLGEDFTLEELARLVCVSRFHFARLFRRSTGHSPMAFLLQARVQRARELLASGAANIADIAAALGFFDQSHFTRTFRRCTGQTPGEFVRHHRLDASRGAHRFDSARAAAG